MYSSFLKNLIYFDAISLQFMSSYEIGEIYAVLTLIDFGRTSALCDRHSNQSSISCFPQVKNFVNFFSFILHKVGFDKSWMFKKKLQLQLEVVAICTVILWNKCHTHDNEPNKH